MVKNSTQELEEEGRESGKERKKAARKERDRLCYLKKKAMNLQRKQEVLKKEQKQLKQNKRSVLVKAKVSNAPLKKLGNQVKEVQVESTNLVNSMRKM